jgi:hypothetical protein
MRQASKIGGFLLSGSTENGAQNGFGMQSQGDYGVNLPSLDENEPGAKQEGQAAQHDKGSMHSITLLSSEEVRAQPQYDVYPHHLICGVLKLCISHHAKPIHNHDNTNNNTNSMRNGTKVSTLEHPFTNPTGGGRYVFGPL